MSAAIGTEASVSPEKLSNKFRSRYKGTFAKIAVCVQRYSWVLLCLIALWPEDRALAHVASLEEKAAHPGAMHTHALNSNDPRRRAANYHSNYHFDETANRTSVEKAIWSDEMFLPNRDYSGFPSFATVPITSGLIKDTNLVRGVTVHMTMKTSTLRSLFKNFRVVLLQGLSPSYQDSSPLADLYAIHQNLIASLPYGYRYVIDERDPGLAIVYDTDHYDEVTPSDIYVDEAAPYPNLTCTLKKDAEWYQVTNIDFSAVQQGYNGETDILRLEDYFKHFNDKGLKALETRASDSVRDNKVLRQGAALLEEPVPSAEAIAAIVGHTTMVVGGNFMDAPHALNLSNQDYAYDTPLDVKIEEYQQGRTRTARVRYEGGTSHSWILYNKNSPYINGVSTTVNSVKAVVPAIAGKVVNGRYPFNYANSQSKWQLHWSREVSKYGVMFSTIIEPNTVTVAPAP